MKKLGRKLYYNDVYDLEEPETTYPEVYVHEEEMPELANLTVGEEISITFKAKLRSSHLNGKEGEEKVSGVFELTEYEINDEKNLS